MQSHVTHLDHGISLFDEWFPAGFAKGRHTHDEGYFCLMVAGGFREHYGRGDREADVGSVVRYAPHEPHSGAFSARPNCIFHIALPEDLSARVLARAGDHWNEDLAGTEVAGLCMRLYTQHRQATGDECGRLSGDEWAAQLIDMTTPTRPSRVRSSRNLSRVRERLHADSSGPLPTLRDCAEEVGLNPSHLARSFRQEFHCTMGDYVRRLRITCGGARILGGEPIATVATDLGFADQAHFTRAFRRQYDVTPGAFRSLHRRGRATRRLGGMS